MKLYIISRQDCNVFNVDDPEDVKLLLDSKEDSFGRILTRLEFVPFLHKLDRYQYVSGQKSITSNLLKSNTTFCGCPIYITANYNIDGIVFISYDFGTLNSESDLNSIIEAVDGVKMRKNLTHALENYDIKPITIKIPKEKQQMKIIDNKNNKHTKPEEFREGDIALDTDGDYFLITSDYTFAAENFDLINIEKNRVIGRSDDIKDLLQDNTAVPLIRIDPDNVKLVIDR